MMDCVQRSAHEGFAAEKEAGVSDTSHGPDWWQASDGKWYPPETHPPQRSEPPAPLPSPAVALPIPAPPPTPSLPSPAPAPEAQPPTPVAKRQPLARTSRSTAGVATSTVGNFLWLVLAGFWLAIGYVIAGLLNMITIIGIPFGIQAFKLAGYALWPFGRVIVRRPDRDAGLSTLGNVIWFVFGGLWLALAHLIVGLLLCVTIIGIPLGLASIKMAGLAIAPFGRQIVPKSQLARMHGYVIVSDVG